MGSHTSYILLLTAAVAAYFFDQNLRLMISAKLFLADFADVFLIFMSWMDIGLVQLAGLPA